MTTLLNTRVYGSLLEKYQPKAIASESEYQKSLDAINDLMAKGEDLSPEESTLLETLAILVESYEEIEFPIPTSSPRNILLHLMEVRSLKQVDLVKVIGSKGVVSEILSGKRAISKSQAKELGAFFHVSPALFI
ncbi:MAG: transcriptional regulator [Oscillatoriales cyanobacterium CG2_30_44_21]|nr:MAG: transcriptional regulator [Oscillatoriales cyanobacterium CG2_30_44_21]